MWLFRRITVPLVVLVALVGMSAFVISRSHAEGKHYVCVPCGLPCDAKVFDQPGTCPQCGMALVEQGSAAAAVEPNRTKVGILIFNGVEIIDYTGPWEMFGSAGYKVYTVAATLDPVTTAMGMTVVPKYTFADAPAPDILLVPGGGVKAASGDSATLSWVKAATASSRQTMSVCNGAFILANAGLLDGLSATTTFGNLDRLKTTYPKIKVVYDKRYVDNGKIITAGGLTSGIDGALHVIDKLEGRGSAQQVALSQEYDWRPGGEFARGALANRLIQQFQLDDLEPNGEWNTVRTEGTRDRWDLSIQGPSKLSAAQLSAKLGELFTTRGKWSAVASAASATAGPIKTRWKFKDADGSSWNGSIAVQGAADDPHKCLVTVQIARAS